MNSSFVDALAIFGANYLYIVLLAVALTWYLTRPLEDKLEMIAWGNERPRRRLASLDGTASRDGHRGQHGHRCLDQFRSLDVHSSKAQGHNGL